MGHARFERTNLVRPRTAIVRAGCVESSQDPSGGQRGVRCSQRDKTQVFYSAIDLPRLARCQASEDLHFCESALSFEIRYSVVVACFTSGASG